MRPPNAPFNRGVVYTIALGHLVHDVFSSFLSPFLPLLIEKFALSMTLVGALSMVFRLTAVANPLLGVLADRFDLRVWFALSPAMTAAAMCMLGQAPNFASACLLVAAAGASASMMHVVGPVFVAEFSGARIGRGMSVWMVGGEAARTIGPLAAVALVAAAGFDRLYPVAVLGAATSVFLWIKLKNVTVPLSSGGGVGVLNAMYRMRGLMLVLSGLLFGRAMVALVIMRYLPTYMVASGMSLWMGGCGLALFELSGVAGAFVAGSRSDNMGRRKVLGYSMLGAPVFMLLFVHASGWFLAPLLACLGLFSMASMPVILAMVQDWAPEYRGAANGLFMGLGALVGSSVLFLAGWLVDAVGFTNAFTLCALAGFACVPLVFLLPGRSVGAEAGAEARKG